MANLLDLQHSTLCSNMLQVEKKCTVAYLLSHVHTDDCEHIGGDIVYYIN